MTLMSLLLDLFLECFSSLGNVYLLGAGGDRTSSLLAPFIPLSSKHRPLKGSVGGTQGRAESMSAREPPGPEKLAPFYPSSLLPDME